MFSSFISQLFSSPYYTVIDGINQVKVYGGKRGKTGVKVKITFALLNFPAECITKFSTSFHPVDSPYCSSEQGESHFQRTLWQQESEISGIISKNG